MASLSKHSRKGVIDRFIQFKDESEKWHTIHLGSVTLKTAQTVRTHVDEIWNANTTRTTIPSVTAAWLGDIADVLYRKLVKHGLVKPRIGDDPVAIGPFIDRYIQKRTDLKPSTLVNLKQAKKKVVGFFTEHRDITTINKGDMQDWHRWLLERLEPASVAGHFKRAKLFFEDAVSRGIIAVNPGKGIKAGSQSNSARKRYVPADDVMQVIAVTPDAEWQLLFALARFAGLRIPSESAALRWVDINFATKKMKIHASKTERHEDKGVRLVPIVKQLMPYLRAAHQRRNASDRYVTPHLRRENLRRMGVKLVERSAVEPWPKLFHNLRASCQTDFARHFPEYVVCDWIGNSEKIARKHYLMVTDEHFEEATGYKGGSPAGASGIASDLERNLPASRSTGTAKEERDRTGGRRGEVASCRGGKEEANTPPCTPPIFEKCDVVNEYGVIPQSVLFPLGSSTPAGSHRTRDNRRNRHCKPRLARSSHTPHNAPLRTAAVLRRLLAPRPEGK